MATVAKIVLKNTTKMSLNERFTAYRAEAQTAASSFRQKIHRQTTSANLRLAQQMANRPTVIAALRLKKRSMQQRLGIRQQPTSNVKSRLNLSAKQFNNNRSIQGRLGSFRGRGFARRGGFKPGTSPLLRGRLGNANSFNSVNTYNQRNGFRQRRNFQIRGGNRQQGGNYRVQLRNARGRNNRGGRGGNRGRGGGRWGKNMAPILPTRQELDNQLDEYMAETKGSFDSHLM